MVVQKDTSREENVSVSVGPSPAASELSAAQVCADTPRYGWPRTQALEDIRQGLSVTLMRRIARQWSAKGRVEDTQASD